MRGAAPPMKNRGREKKKNPEKRAREKVVPWDPTPAVDRPVRKHPREKSQEREIAVPNHAADALRDPTKISPYIAHLIHKAEVVKAPPQMQWRANSLDSHPDSGSESSNVDKGQSFDLEHHYDAFFADELGVVPGGLGYRNKGGGGYREDNYNNNKLLPSIRPPLPKVRMSST